MVQDIIDKWYKRKDSLKKYFEENPMECYDEYEEIVKLLFKFIINDRPHSRQRWNTDKMTIIDDGEYQGTQIFIIPRYGYQPDIEDYLITHTYYGSCSGCDTLMGIIEYPTYEKKPSEGKVNDLMTLSLHLIQRMEILGQTDYTH